MTQGENPSSSSVLEMQRNPRCGTHPPVSGTRAENGRCQLSTAKATTTLSHEGLLQVHGSYVLRQNPARTSNNNKQTYLLIPRPKTLAKHPWVWSGEKERVEHRPCWKTLASTGNKPTPCTCVLSVEPFVFPNKTPRIQGCTAMCPPPSSHQTLARATLAMSSGKKCLTAEVPTTPLGCTCLPFLPSSCILTSRNLALTLPPKHRSVCAARYTLLEGVARRTPCSRPALLWSCAQLGGRCRRRSALHTAHCHVCVPSGCERLGNMQQ